MASAPPPTHWGLAELGELSAPRSEPGKPEPIRDQLVQEVLAQNFIEEVLPVRVILQLGHRLVPELKQLLTGDPVLEVLDPLEQVLVVALPEGWLRPAPPGPSGPGPLLQFRLREHDGF